MFSKTYINISKILFLSLLFTANAGFGQRPLEIDEIKVVAPYEPSISDAFKININPVILDTMTVQIDFDYSIQPRKIVTRFEPEPLSPARMRGEPLAKLYRGLVKGGFGNYQTPYFEGFYNTLRSNEYALGVHLRHLSSGNDIEGYDRSTFSQNKANFYGTRFFRNTSLDASVLFDRHSLRYYGLPENDTLFPAGADTKQRFELLSSTIGFGTHFADSTRLNYRFGLEHHWLNDRFDASEHHFRATAMLGRDIGEDPFGLAWKQYFQLDVSADYFYKKAPGFTQGVMPLPTDTFNTGIYSIRPGIYSYYDRIKFNIGINLSVQDSIANYEVRAYPVAGFEAMIVPDKLLFHVGLKGGLEKQSLRRLTDTNPFVHSSVQTGFSNVRSEISGGFRGSFGNKLSYNLSVINSNIDNYPLFFNMYRPDGPFPMLDNRFGLFYDDVTILNFRAELSARFGERFSMRLQGDYFDYSLEQMLKAWHMPDYTMSLNMKYNLQDKIILTADLFGRGPAYGIDLENFANPARRLHDFYLDANLGVEYRYTKVLSVFLNFYNMQNESYERWTYYPTQSFGFLGGISYSFR